jgi:hypothetical protein
MLVSEVNYCLNENPDLDLLELSLEERLHACLGIRANCTNRKPPII